MTAIKNLLLAFLAKVRALLSSLKLGAFSTVWEWIKWAVGGLWSSTKTVIATPMTYPLVAAVFVGGWVLGHGAGAMGKAYWKDEVKELARRNDILVTERDAAVMRARTAEAKVTDLSAPKAETAAAPEPRPRQAPRRVSNPAPKADSLWQFKF